MTKRLGSIFRLAVNEVRHFHFIAMLSAGESCYTIMALYNTCVGKHRQVPGALPWVLCKGNAMLRGETFIYHADIHSLGGLKGTNVVALMVRHST